ncbi:MAG: sodium:solute symporter [Chlorobiaceae bacterium]|nr:sodium:solute symporter [Chlorobiaceae bacterium]NTW74718.1 sodium:solute symporter [Chlorobiaceae bacterium]
MQPLDLSIVLLFLAANTLFGLWHGRSNKSTGDYFLGGHKLPWIASMFSIVASETSMLTFVSVPGLAYRGDWTFLQLAMGYIVGRVLVSAILLPLYFAHGVNSIYQVIGIRFGPQMQKVASTVFLVTRTLGDALRLFAAGAIVEVVTGWSLPVSIVVIGLVTLIYTLFGGIKAVVWLESFQFGLYLAGGLVSIAFIMNTMDVPMPELLTRLQAAGKLRIINPDSHIFTNPLAFFGAFFGGALLSLCSHGVDHMMVQRVLGCRDLSAARKAMVGSGFFVLFQFTVFLLAGSMIYLFMQAAPMQKDREFANFIVHQLPSGLKGLLIAGVLSAAMSTHSSAINSLASSTVNDLLGGRATLGTSRLISLAWAVLLVAIAPLFDTRNEAIVMLGLEIASFTYGGLLGLFLFSRSSMKLHPVSLSVGLIASMAIVFLLKFLGLAWTWYISVSVLVNLLVTIAIEATAFRNKQLESR